MSLVRVECHSAAAECWLSHRLDDPFVRTLVSLPLSHTPIQRWVGQPLSLVYIKLDIQPHVKTTSQTVTLKESRTLSSCCIDTQHSNTCQGLKWLPLCRWVFISSAFRTVNNLTLTCLSLRWWSVQTSFVQLWKAVMGFTSLAVKEDVENGSLTVNTT